MHPQQVCWDEVADAPEGCAAIQQDLDRLESSAERIQMRKASAESYSWGGKNMHQYRLGADLLERSSLEKDLDVLVFGWT